MPTSYVGPRGHTEENKRTAQGQGSQHSISSRHTLQTANSGGCARSTIKSSAGCVPRCSDSSKNATRNSTMTNGGTKRAPWVGRTDMTYRRPRSGRSASTHGWYPEAKILGTGAMTGDEPRVVGLVRLVRPLSRRSDSEAAPVVIGFVRLVRLVRLNFVSARPAHSAMAGRPVRPRERGQPV